MVTADTLKNIGLLSSLTDQEIDLLTKHSSEEKLPRRKRLYETGDEIAKVYIVKKGSVKLGSDIDAQKSLVKHIAYEGDVFGENVFSGNVHTEYAEAIKDSDLIAIDVQLFKRLLELNARFANKITEVIIERINNLEQRMKNFIFMKAHVRIANFLKQTALARGIKIGMDEVLINHGMSHKDISFLTDTSRQTVTRVLADLKNSNCIHFSARKPNKILIRNISAL